MPPLSPQLSGQQQSTQPQQTPQSLGPSRPEAPDSQTSGQSQGGQAQAPQAQAPQAQAQAWHRPWETSRDRSSFAIGFSTSLVNDVFMELSRTFLLALRLGIAENPPAHSSEATVRPSDLYFLHVIMRRCHDGLSKVVGLLSAEQRGLLQQLIWLSTAQVVMLLLMVHIAFVCPYTQIDSSLRLSRFVALEGGWGSFRCYSNIENLTAHAAASPTIVRVELLDTWWARPPPVAPASTFSETLQEFDNKTLSQEAVKPPLLETGAGSKNDTEDGSDILANVLRRLSALAYVGYDAAFPRPTYEVTLGATAPWLDIESTAFRDLGVRTKHVKISVEDPKYFGIYLARTLLSSLGLHDIYMLHALPRHFLTDSDGRICGTDFRPSLHIRTVTSKRGISLEPVESRIAAGQKGRVLGTVVSNLASSMLFLGAAIMAAVLFSAFLRRLLVLSCRMYIYNMLCLRQMRHFAFIAEQMRRVNRAPSTVLIELWIAWAASAGIMLWILIEALQRSFVWFLWILCYALAEFWGLAHVRTKQSRWLYPRSLLLLHAGAALYAYWWPRGPLWLLLASLFWAHASIMFTLISDLDCCFALPSEPPNEVLAASLLLPAMPLSRSEVSKQIHPGPDRDDTLSVSETGSPGSSEANVE
ncbi:unnamed protein product [Symbiodinium sp. CCMP2456]|nr:unnamed protein product [Symbiodinium sp. CCMP2456]